MRKYAQFLLIIFAFLAGSFATLATGMVFANGSDPSQIHGCIRNNGLLAGFVRIVGINVTCANNETPLNWKQGLNDPPFACPGCNFTETLGNRFVGKDFTNSTLAAAGMSGANLSSTIFINADLAGTNFSAVNATNANFTNANLTHLEAGAANFTNTNLTNVNATDASFVLSNLANANLTNANLTNASLDQATGLTTATLTGATWSNTTCPDGTNSDNNGNTCVGHLTP
jgi:hypothetical protein